ncbi:Putative colanic biosynthesis UDP-glucose lipid carrier transferase [Aerococcus viridans]|nr:Putative colanic biosynthesis UDP-glucose lipid carrier transferase [Aerococcus viridans]
MLKCTLFIHNRSRRNYHGLLKDKKINRYHTFRFRTNHFSSCFLILILAIKVDSPGPVLFKQKRVGIHKSHFHILKFRTMRIDTPKDTPTHLLENPDQWITKVGKFLRRTSLDELPQIINIFKGEMSIIGPRPALGISMI